MSVNHSLLTRFIPQHGGWQTHQLSLDNGQLLNFRNGKICRDIALTQSDCIPLQGFRSRIAPTSDVVIFAVGLQGTNFFSIDKGLRQATVNPGDVWLVRPHEITLLRDTPAQNKASMLAIKVHTNRIVELLEDDYGLSSRVPDRALRLLQSSALSTVRPLLEQPLDTPLHRLQAESLMLGLLADWLADTPHFPQFKAQLSPHERQAVVKVIQRLTEEFSTPPSLAQLATLANMSHTRLNRCFRKALGTTIFCWLRDFRLQRACTYLRANQQSITDIALLCGISSASHFTNAFQQKYSLTPSQYRQQYR